MGPTGPSFFIYCAGSGLFWRRKKVADFSAFKDRWKRKFQLFDFDRKTITKSRNLSYINGTFVNKFTKPCYFTEERNELGVWTCIISYFMYFFTLIGFLEITCNQYYRFFFSYGVLRFQSGKRKYFVGKKRKWRNCRIL